MLMMSDMSCAISAWKANVSTSSSPCCTSSGICKATPRRLYQGCSDSYSDNSPPDQPRPSAAQTSPSTVGRCKKRTLTSPLGFLIEARCAPPRPAVPSALKRPCRTRPPAAVMSGEAAGRSVGPPPVPFNGGSQRRSTVSAE